MKRGPVALGIIAVLVIMTLAALPATIRLAVDWYWFVALDFQTIFLKTLWTKVLLGLGVGVLAFAFFYANLLFAQRGLVPDPVVVNINMKVPKVDITRLLRLLALPVSAFLAVLFGISSSSAWLVVLRFWHRSPFGVNDPVFGRDIGYYFFSVPAAQAAVLVVLSVTIITLFMVTPLYLVRGDLLVQRRRLTIEPSAGRHLAVLFAVVFIATAANVVWVRIPGLLFSNTGAVVGASYSDLTARLPVLRVSAVVAVIGAGLVLWGARSNRLPVFLAVAVGLYFITGILGGAYPAAIQQLIVAPNELVKETPYIQRHIDATRAAWGLDEVESRTISGEARLTLSDIQANSGTVKNVRLWDRAPLLQTFGQLQEIRTYYDFVSVDDDRYIIDGELRQVLLSPRELNSASLPNRNFINERLRFTHGMGLTLSPVNQVTPQGLPVLFVKDIPPASNVSISVERPQIYYGELSNDYVFVNTGQPEFDYPSGDSSATTVYDGEGGVRVNSVFRKAIFSARFRSLKILLSDDITVESRALYYRNIRERVRKALPFLSWDADPYIVVTADGNMKWILDAYTRGSRYPYAQALADGTNYLRNSVKVIIDAYDGSLDAFIADEEDPVIATYAKMFPGIFRPLDEMSADMRSHLRYPEDLFRAQTALYTIYHMTDPDIFYPREDQWQIPVVSGREGSRDAYLRHMVMRLPGEAKEEFIIMTPFTPRQKNNLAAWMVVRNDGENYGQLVVYRFPRQSLVFGPTQIVNRINQDTEISRQISLWDQRGSEVIRGNLLVIPIEESVLFVQALYLRAEGGRIPEMKRVIVAFQNQVVMEETLEGSLSRLFGGVLDRETDVDLSVQLPIAVAGAGEAADPAFADLVQRAQSHYQRALDAQRVGDWATYGEEIDQVGVLLRRLRQMTAGTGGS